MQRKLKNEGNQFLEQVHPADRPVRPTASRTRRTDRERPDSGIADRCRSHSATQATRVEQRLEGRSHNPSLKARAGSGKTLAVVAVRCGFVQGSLEGLNDLTGIKDPLRPSTVSSSQSAGSSSVALFVCHSSGRKETVQNSLSKWPNSARDRATRSRSRSPSVLLLVHRNRAENCICQNPRLSLR